MSLNPEIAKLLDESDLLKYTNIIVPEYQKFAELIIKKCADIADKNRTALEMDRNTHLAADAIKEHFGVEQSAKVEPLPKCSVCGTTENVRWMGGYQPWLCPSPDCIPF